MIDTTNREVRQVKTPDGIGTFWGVDDKEKPARAMVTVKVDGFKVPQTRAYDLKELEEVQK